MRKLVWIGIAWGLMLGSVAQAAPFLLEGPIVSTRAEATAMSKQASAAGVKARVVRRFGTDGGWEYLMRIEGYAEEQAAVKDGRTIADAVGTKLVVLEIEGRGTRAVGVIEPAGSLAAAPQQPEAVEEPKATADEVVNQVIRAHGGKAGGTAPLDNSEKLLVRYQRTLPDGRVVDHTWARNGESFALQIAVVKGDGVSSILRIKGDTATLEVNGEQTTQDLERAKMTMEQFSIGRAIPFVLEFGAAYPNREELQQLRQAESPEGEVWLTYDGDRASGRLMLAVGANDYLVRQVSFGDNGISHRFEEYFEPVSAVMVPRKVVSKTAREDSGVVTVSEVTIDPQFPAGLFLE